MDTIYYVVNRLVYSRGRCYYPTQRPDLSLIGVFDDEEKARTAMKENAISFILSYGCGPQHLPEDADKWFNAFFKDDRKRSWEYSDEFKFVNYEISTGILNQYHMRVFNLIRADIRWVTDKQLSLSDTTNFSVIGTYTDRDTAMNEMLWRIQNDFYNIWSDFRSRTETNYDAEKCFQEWIDDRFVNDDEWAFSGGDRIYRIRIQEGSVGIF